VNQALQLSVTEPNCSTKNKPKLFCSSSTISKDNAVKKNAEVEIIGHPSTYWYSTLNCHTTAFFHTLSISTLTDHPSVLFYVI